VVSREKGVANKTALLVNLLSFSVLPSDSCLLSPLSSGSGKHIHNNPLLCILGTNCGSCWFQ